MTVVTRLAALCIYTAYWQHSEWQTAATRCAHSLHTGTRESYPPSSRVLARVCPSGSCGRRLRQDPRACSPERLYIHLKISIYSPTPAQRASGSTASLDIDLSRLSTTCHDAVFAVASSSFWPLGKPSASTSGAFSLVLLDTMQAQLTVEGFGWEMSSRRRFATPAQSL
jgi:hypothetical protein